MDPAGVACGVGCWWAARASQVVASRGQGSPGPIPSWMLAHTSLGSNLKFHN